MPPPPDSRPNIILIVTDQQRYDTIAALGYPHVDTPHLDRLVREGTTLDQCFVTAPSCVPSRASLFTGLYPHTSGILKNGDPWSRTWVEQLQAGGYYCVNIGKMHTWPYDAPAGFHERYVVENKDRYLEARWYFDEWDKALAARGLVKQQREHYRTWPGYRESLGAFDWKLPEDAHPDAFVGGMARWWLETKPKPSQPLFLQVGFPGPHPPYDPPRRFAEPYLHRDLPLDPVEEDELRQQPAALQQLRRHNFDVDHDSVVHLPAPTRDQRHRQRAHYLGNVTLIDEQIGCLLETLQRRGFLENAVVIFTSDHGDCLTDHGHSQKWTMYDAVLRVPAVAWSPGRIAAGRRIDALVQWMDLGPTILDFAAVTPPPWMEAQSLAPALLGHAAPPAREFVISEHGRDGILDGTDFMIAIRDRHWKLVLFADHPDGQLFDLREDPGERRNLWSHRHPGIQRERERLRAELLTHLLRSHCRTRSWAAAFR